MEKKRVAFHNYRIADGHANKDKDGVWKQKESKGKD